LPESVKHVSISEYKTFNFITARSADNCRCAYFFTLRPQDEFATDKILSSIWLTVNKIQNLIFKFVYVIFNSRKWKKVDVRMYTKVIMVCSNKGGVGKTTCTAAIADILARKMNLPTLIIDADPQGNISSRFGYRPELVPVNNSLDTCLLNALNVNLDPASNQPIPVNYFFNDCKMYSKLGEDKLYGNMKIICSSSALEKIISMYAAVPQGSDGIWRDIIREIKNLDIFEYVLIDTQASMSYFFNQIMMAADYLLVPVEPAEDSFSGAKAVGNVFNSVAKKKSSFKIDDKIEFLGVFFNKWRIGTIAAQKFEQNIQQIWNDNPIFKTKVPMNQDAINAANEFAPVTSAKPYSPAARAFEKLTREVVEKID